MKLHTGGSYFVVRWTWYGKNKGEPQDFVLLHGERTKRLVHWQSVSWNNELVYWLKVNSFMTMITDHLWWIHFHDQCFQCNLLSAINAFWVWAWFLVRDSEDMSVLYECLNMSLSYVILQSSLVSLNSLFNHAPDWLESWSQFGTYPIYNIMWLGHSQTSLGSRFLTVCSECGQTLWSIPSSLSNTKFEMDLIPNTPLSHTWTERIKKRDIQENEWLQFHKI